MYRDKETFLTGAYRKKLEERKKMEEELRKEAAIEGECCPLHVRSKCTCGYNIN